MSNEYNFVIVIKDIKDPNGLIGGGTSNKYKGAYKKIFDILDEDSIFVQSEVEDEILKGDDFYLYFNSFPDADKLQRISKIPNVEILNKNFAKGGRTISQTPAPKKDQVYGSSVNKSKSSTSLASAKLIKFDDKTLEAIKSKVSEHNKSYPNKKINLSSAKAVVRRGFGAYSSSHRPTISGGKPNSRVAWGLARLNAFIYKIVNGKSKSGKYKQDDDLIEELGYEVENYENGGKMKKDIRCVNCGWEWDKKDSEAFDMCVCHKCGFDNTTFYSSIPVNNYSKGGAMKNESPDYLKMFLDL
jgi:hypothetical protein